MKFIKKSKNESTKSNSIAKLYAENKASGIARRGYALGWYAFLRFAWSSYWIVMMTGTSVYFITMGLIPVTAVWYASAIGVTAGIDTLTMVSLYYVPFLFICGLLFVLECTMIKKFTHWIFSRHKRFCVRYYEKELVIKHTKK